MSHDPMKVCNACVEPIRSDVEGRWIWERRYIPAFTIDDWQEVGPYHIGCAEAMCEDDPDRFQLTEPDQEPSTAQLERMNNADSGPTGEQERAALRDAGR